MATREEILALVDRWQKALNGHDTDGLVGLFTPDAEFLTSFRIVPAGQVFRGTAEIRRFFTELFQHHARLRAELDRVLVDSEQGSVAVEYRWGSPADDGPVDWVATALLADLQGSSFSSFRFYRRG